MRKSERGAEFRIEVKNGTRTDLRTSISILFVEDDDLILELQSSMLVMKFPDVGFYTANNGKTGLEIFKIHTPDIVLTDINMSEMCGVQMSRNIHALKPDTKFIAITGNSEQFIPHNSDNNKFRFNYIIVKPVDLSELYSVIERCIDEILHPQA